MKRVLVCAAVIACLVGGFAPTPASGQVPCTWEIGFMGALSGDYARYGRPIKRGVELAVTQANGSGDLPCTLELVAKDSQGDPNQAPPLARNLVDRERMVACMCGVFSGETLATGSIFSEGHLLMASTGTNPANSRQGFSTYFRVVANDNDQGTSLARFVRSEFAAQRVVLAHDGQDYSVGVFRKLKRVLDERVVAVERLDPYRSRYNAVAGRILDHNPDIVIYAGYPEQAAPLLVHLRDAGYRAPYVTTNSTDSRYFEQVVRRHDWDSPVRAFTSCGCADASKLGRADGFVKAYRAEFSEAPREYAGDIYDVMQIVVNFLKNRSATDTIDDLRRALVNRFDNVRGFSGIMKPYSWARNGELHANDRHTFMYRMRNGSWSMTGSVKKLLAN